MMTEAATAFGRGDFVVMVSLREVTTFASVILQAALIAQYEYHAKSNNVAYFANNI